MAGGGGVPNGGGGYPSGGGMPSYAPTPGPWWAAPGVTGNGGGNFGGNFGNLQMGFGDLGGGGGNFGGLFQGYPSPSPGRPQGGQAPYFPPQYGPDQQYGWPSVNPGSGVPQGGMSPLDYAFGPGGIGGKLLGGLKRDLALYPMAAWIAEKGFGLADTVLPNVAELGSQGLGWLGALLGGGAGGAAEAAGNAIGGALGPTAAAYGFVMNNPFEGLNTYFQDQNQIAAQQHESRNINRAFDTALGQQQAGQQAYLDLAGGKAVSRDQLYPLEQAVIAQMGDAISQYMGTGGGRNTNAGIPGQDAQTMDRTAQGMNAMEAENVFGLLAAEDQAARQGVPIVDFGMMGPYIEPMRALRWATQNYAGLPQTTWNLPQDVTDAIMAGPFQGNSSGFPTQTNESAQTFNAPKGFNVDTWRPGTYLQTLQQFLAPYNTNWGQSAYGQITAPFKNLYGAPTAAQQLNMAKAWTDYQHVLAQQMPGGGPYGGVSPWDTGPTTWLSGGGG